MSSLKIAIIGAGPAGCALARLLQTNAGAHVNVTIFEAEAGLDFRSQGGSLDLHIKTGQAALRAAGLFDKFLEHARYDGEALKICDKDLLCYLSVPGSTTQKGKSKSRSRPEIDRPKLREILFKSLANDTVKWSHKLTRVDDNNTIHFANGNSMSGFDLIVGADGAWSKVRPRLSDVTPVYSGLAGCQYEILNAEDAHPELYKLLNRGSVFSFSEGKSIMAQIFGNGSINVSTWRQEPVDWQTTCGYDVHDLEATKNDVLRKYTDWDQRLLDFVLKSDVCIGPRDLYMLPVGHAWAHVPGVTLIGDASHLMTPFAGQGVNIALEDALKLSQHISSAAKTANPRATLDAQLIDFEKDMFARAEFTQKTTMTMMNAMYFVPGAPRSNIEKYILGALRGDMNKAATTVLTPLVYAWYLGFKLVH